MRLSSTFALLQQLMSKVSWLQETSSPIRWVSTTSLICSEIGGLNGVYLGRGSAATPQLFPGPLHNRLLMGDPSCPSPRAEGVSVEEVTGPGHRRAVTRVRAGLAYVWIEWLDQSGGPLARLLGIRPLAVYPIAQRGRAEASHWQQLFASVIKDE